MKIFFVAQRVPFPPNRGDKITTFNEIRYLAKENELHVFCLADGPEDLQNVDELRNYAASVTAVPVGKIAANLRVALALARNRPLSVAYFDEIKLHQEIRRRHAEINPDVVFVYSANVAQFAENFAQTPRIMQFADLDSIKWAQYAEHAKVPMRWVYKIEAKRLLDYERHIARTFSHSLICTEKEKADFEALIPGVRTSCVPNGVDLDFFNTAGRQKKPRSLIFTGVMNYFPNVDGVQWFCDEVLQPIQARLPDVKFTICGAFPSREVEALKERPGVIVTGRVPDVRPFLDEAAVAVVPLRLGRGIQNKLLEAMSMGLPCVTTTSSWQGTSVPKGDGILVADDPEAFAQCVVELLQDEDFRQDMSRRARGAVERLYRWDDQLALLDQVLEEAVSAAKSQ